MLRLQWHNRPLHLQWGTNGTSCCCCHWLPQLLHAVRSLQAKDHHEARLSHPHSLPHLQAGHKHLHRHAAHRAVKWRDLHGWGGRQWRVQLRARSFSFQEQALAGRRQPGGWHPHAALTSHDHPMMPACSPVQGPRRCTRPAGRTRPAGPAPRTATGQRRLPARGSPAVQGKQACGSSAAAAD